MFQKFKDLIKKLFGAKPIQDDRELQKSEIDALRYMDISNENITAIISNALSILTFGDAQISIDGSGNIVDLLQDIINKEFTVAKRNISCALGTGMIVSIPYCVDGGIGRKIYVDTVTKDRAFITRMYGNDITQIVVLADVFSDNSSVYTRWTYYTVENGNYIIQNKCLKDNTEVDISLIDVWSNIEPEITISGVSKLPVGIFNCPASGRRPDGNIGLPITFGCDATLRKIEQTFKDIEVEFKRKRTKVFADRTLLRAQYDENGNIVKQDFDDDLFVKFGSTDNFTTEIFSPEFRDTSYFNKLQSHFEFLEKQIGLSKGILTELNTQGATATEIKRSTYQTFCLVDDIRKEYEKYVNDLIYGIEVLANAYGMAASSDCSATIDWSYAMLEDTTESFNQSVQAVGLGAERLAELRMFLHPDETLDEAQAVIDEIAEENPSIDKLFAGNSIDMQDNGDNSIEEDANAEKN